MVLHMVALATVQVTSHGLRSAVVALKILMGLRLFRDDALRQSRLFLFQLSQIAFNSEAQVSNVARMERALRLIWRTLTPPSPAPSSSSENSQIVQESLHDLSMLSL